MNHTRTITTTLLLGLTISLMGQAKLPKLMVVPSDVWCHENGCMETMEVMGEQVSYPDYKRAMQTNRDLMAVIGKINTLMAERGFPLQDMSQTLRSIERTNQENSVLRTKTSGASLAESPVDRLRRTARADIILEVDWGINKTDRNAPSLITCEDLMLIVTSKWLVPREPVLLPSLQRFLY